eukprot:TRINITY_DN19682_c0_g1_i1.p1 TRINITY_DN19682_c0_g1~~TRINITY_DN19682_c0_g1_i1.p1  ORF type:complete len:513 (+),score=133.66 TRINITY_DN19682_c0_g1_i1:61-1599(+)
MNKLKQLSGRLRQTQWKGRTRTTHADGNIDVKRMLRENDELQKKLEVLTSKMEEWKATQEKLEHRLETVDQLHTRHEYIDFVASKEITPLNLGDLVEYCKHEDYKTHLFLHRELPIRTAVAIHQLGHMPHGFTTMKSTRLVKQWLIDEFTMLTEAEKPDTPEREEAFTKLLRKIHKKYQESIITLGKGLWELKRDMLQNKVKIKDKKQEWSRINELIIQEYPQLQEELDRYYAGRISAGFLIRQHIAIAAMKKRPPRKGAEDYIGLVCRKTDLHKVCRGAIQEAKEICEEQYGNSPEIKLTRTSKQGEGVQIPHIPAHLHYILFELLKNSLRATIEKHCTAPKYDCSHAPRIEVTVCDTDRLEDLSVKVSDKGGGIPIDNMDKVMSYMYTTAEVSQFDVMLDDDETAQQHTTPLAGFGYGLPISRLYAQHFDGDLRLLSVEGHGTDAYLHLGRSLKSTFETGLRNQRREESRKRKLAESWLSKRRGSSDEPAIRPTSLDDPSYSPLGSTRYP